MSEYFRRATPVRLLAVLALAALVLLSARTQALAGEEPSARAPLEEAALAAMLDGVVRYYDETRQAEGQILALLPAYEKNKDSVEYRKLRFLFDTHQKVTTSLNNLVDILYMTLSHGDFSASDINEYLFNRSRNIITFLNNMVYFLTARNQEMELSSGTDVQKLYESYLVRLTTLLYEINKQFAQFHKS